MAVRARGAAEETAMISYTETETVTEQDLELLRRATALVARVPGKLYGRWVRCHELARAVGRVLDLPVVDGRYGAMEHSWLYVPPASRALVLDVYVPGALPQVQLCASWLGAPVMYRAGKDRTDIRVHIVERLLSKMRGDPFASRSNLRRSGLSSGATDA